MRGGRIASWALQMAGAALTLVCFTVTGGLLLFWSLSGLYASALYNGDSAFIAPSPWWMFLPLLVQTGGALAAAWRVWRPSAEPERQLRDRVIWTLLGLANVGLLFLWVFIVAWLDKGS